MIFEGKDCHHLKWAFKANIKVNSEPSPKKECDLCDKKFRNPPHLARHRKLHDTRDLKPFQCPKCVLVFRENYNLKKHINCVHGNGESFPCDKCKKTYKHKNSLAIHIDIAHNIDKSKTFNCTKCGKSFTHEKILRRHELKTHIVGELDCSLCDRMFKKKSTLEKHLSTVHKEAVSPRK